jgi:hypothetical protein
MAARVRCAIHVADTAATTVADGELALTAPTNVGAVRMTAAFARTAIAQNRLKTCRTCALGDLPDNFFSAEWFLNGNHNEPPVAYSSGLPRAFQSQSHFYPLTK